MKKNLVVPLNEDADVRYASELASLTASDMGFDNTSCAELALAVSEIAQNVIRYAVEGKASFSMPNGRKVLTVSIADDGPGIENLEKAKQNGFSTGKGSLGIGLDVAKRSVDEFDIKTDSKNGTQITLKKFLPIPDDQIEYGIVSIADDNYAINGDDYLIKEYDGDKVLLAVIDGTGEGYPAHAAALLVKEYLQGNYRLSLEELAINCHEILKGSDLDRGAAVALAKIEEGYLHYLGIGDTHTYLLGEEIKFLVNHEGTVGQFQLPSLKAKRVEIEEGSYVVLCTDGVKSNLWFDEDETMGAQKLANTIFSEFHKSYGDVTVLVAKYFGV